MPSSPPFQDVQHRVLLNHPFIQRSLPSSADAARLATVPSTLSKPAPAQLFPALRKETGVLSAIPPPNAYPISLGHPAFPPWTSTWAQVPKSPRNLTVEKPKVLVKARAPVRQPDPPMPPFHAVRAYLVGSDNRTPPDVRNAGPRDIRLTDPVPHPPQAARQVLSRLAMSPPSIQPSARAGHTIASPQGRDQTTVSIPSDAEPPHCLESITHASHNLVRRVLDRIAILISLIVLLVLFGVHLTITVFVLPAALVIDWMAFLLKGLLWVLTAQCCDINDTAASPALTQSVWNWSTRSTWIRDTLHRVPERRGL